jgi:hypothetical protein
MIQNGTRAGHLMYLTPCHMCCWLPHPSSVGGEYIWSSQDDLKTGCSVARPSHVQNRPPVKCVIDHHTRSTTSQFVSTMHFTHDLKLWFSLCGTAFSCTQPPPSHVLSTPHPFNNNTVGSKYFGTYRMILERATVMWRSLLMFATARHNCYWPPLCLGSK